jgi:surface carbohydrate biosynthesis protein (TIGR04326 family)
VPRHLEEHAERIRRKYLAFIHDLGELQIDGRAVVDHFDLGDGFSYWWMSPLAEKSPLKSPGIYTCLRLLALEEMLLEFQPTALVSAGSDATLAEALRHLCGKLGIRFTWQPGADAGSRPSIRALYDGLPHVVKALLSLRNVIQRWPLRAVRSPPWFAGDAAIFICSYFIHLDPASCGAGRFHSRQWEVLPRFLQAAGRRLNWLQLFLFSAVVPTVATGIDWVGRFNRDSANQGQQSFVDSYLNVRTVGRAVANWLRLVRIGRRLSSIRQHFEPAGSSVSFWPVLRNDWRSSVAGTAAMTNCLAVAQFDAALADVPRQPTGLYLCENQGWEKALLRAWRKHGHGQITGVQHATVPFWHLYYFDDPRSWQGRSRNAQPLPDRLAVNGAVSRQAFTDAQYPTQRLIDTEALRYLHLQEDASRPARSGRGAQEPVRVLVLGDLMPASMDHLLNLFRGVRPLLPPRYEFTLKPHPGLAIDLNRYPGLDVPQTREPLGKILSQYDVAFAANITSAAVDAYVAGLSVVIALDGDALNLSPLRGQPGARFVSTSEELAEALQAAGIGAAPASRQEFFYLDSGLPRWKRALEFS